MLRLAISVPIPMRYLSTSMRTPLPLGLSRQIFGDWGTFHKRLSTLWFIYALSMVYLWIIYGLYIYGLSMDYLWSKWLHGVYMVYTWGYGHQAEGIHQALEALGRWGPFLFRRHVGMGGIDIMIVCKYI